MTDKLQKDLGEETPMDDQVAGEMQEQDMNQEDSAEDVNSKGGATSDEGLGGYEAGYFESVDLDGDDEEMAGETAGDQSQTTSQSTDEDEIV